MLAIVGHCREIAFCLSKRTHHARLHKNQPRPSRHNQYAQLLTARPPSIGRSVRRLVCLDFFRVLIVLISMLIFTAGPVALLFTPTRHLRLPENLRLWRDHCSGVAGEFLQHACAICSPAATCWSCTSAWTASRKFSR